MRSSSRYTTYVSPEHKEKINHAFRLMRKAGLMAKQNFSCCGSCMVYEMCALADGLKDKGKTVPFGYVGYNKQTTNSVNSGRDFYLRFGSFTTNDDAKEHEDDIKVGHMIVKAFTEAGVNTEWNGNTSTAICVKNVVA